MPVFRCTKSLLKSMKVKPVALDDRLISPLGDWTAKLVRVGRANFVVAVSEPTRLGVVIAAAPFASITERFAETLLRLLLEIGILSEDAEREATAMATAPIAASNSRSVLGTLNDYARHVDSEARRGEQCTGRLAHLHLAWFPVLTPAGPPPIDRARAAFGLPPADYPDELRLF